jgi:hypothetical protein
MRMRMSMIDVGMRLGDAIDPFQLANGFEAVFTALSQSPSHQVTSRSCAADDKPQRMHEWIDAEQYVQAFCFCATRDPTSDSRAFCTRAGMGTTLDALLHRCQVGRHRCHPACPRRFGAARMPSVDMLVLPKPSKILGIFAPTISPCQPGRPWPSRLQRGWMRPAPGFARRPSPLSHRSLNLSRTTVTEGTRLGRELNCLVYCDTKDNPLANEWFSDLVFIDG